MITLAYSTCPNDTYIFGPWAEGRISAPAARTTLLDIDELNSLAARGGADVCKVSFYAFLSFLEREYELCPAGAALGRGCGPLLVARKDFDKPLARATVAVPGMETTARLLLRFFSPTGRQTALRFDAIMPAVAQGRFDLGLVIHESRFTYPQYGLICVRDLGQYWEERTGLPIPLGGIAIRRSLAPETRHAVAQAIRDGLDYSKMHYDRILPYIRRYAGEMDDEVIRKHIDLYVNDFTFDLGEEGWAAVAAMKKLLP
jgi:1,4-dihydroxy-6-naphthoate synthase